MSTNHTDTSRRQQVQPSVNGGAGGAIYLLGVIGAIVFFWAQAHSFVQYLAAVLKALVWPAFIVFGALRALFG
ncbi:hypothetical protein MLP_30710 [Microlunatus phosphovorus NM-1]|uniref:Uncharacterized protein n=1 Tax=Microlunatus phosphovorus (strain ATCC 700054 / DSM 10555 / JCM 9379 / NBRC 101784 / NCIMB 13414 / VKM Ac-1990 / NM-1) TaxID=1032480 RepID=F5XKL3_MICPN|nr:hypothetical protein [Microlunatus phosphovorus]BAK36085.1 hypothetical protein MLP_30710 [Microlunatus phosphovorus NM-1]